MRFLVCANDADAAGAEILQVVRGGNARFLWTEALCEPGIERIFSVCPYVRRTHNAPIESTRSL